MLYITIFHNDNDSREIEWHIGEKNPVMEKYEEGFLATAPIIVQADCDELVFIKNTMPGIPTSIAKRVQRWTGDFARFIAMNL